LFGDRKSYTGHGPCLYLRPSTNLRKISGVIYIKYQIQRNITRTHKKSHQEVLMTLNYRKLASNALAAFFAQGISMLISAMTSIFVPKIMGVEDFGYWQLFMFYASYVGFFHLGINDGVYLEQGEKHDLKSTRKR
ncbi:lipopolysaccharide biosynthesis protein, partial [Bifidobacterium longum]|uniref:lipopolysaccharide biosynthesis protein n=1 Tax=Bifidobacterium longum TaxID=216816 RepID=UPI0039B0B411